MSISIGFTGTRQGMTPEQRSIVISLLRSYRPISSLHHGDCIGADAEFHAIGVKLGLKSRITIHPPDRPEYRAYCEAPIILPELPYLVRDKAIVTDTQKLIATPKEGYEIVRSGTWATVRYAKSFGRAIVVVYPDGSIETEVELALSH